MQIYLLQDHGFDCLLGLDSYFLNIISVSVNQSTF